MMLLSGEAGIGKSPMLSTVDFDFDLQDWQRAKLREMQAICERGGPSVILKSDGSDYAIFPRQPA
jgi:hypothetical protein